MLLLNKYTYFFIFVDYFLFNCVSSLPENDNLTIPKISKCCKVGEALLDPAQGCISSSIEFSPPFVDQQPDEVVLIIGLNCEHGKYRLEPEQSSEDEFHLLVDGRLSVPFQEQQMLTPLDYCLDNTLVDDDDDLNQVKVLPFVCFPPPQYTDEENKWRKLSQIIFPIGCLTSVPFLIIVTLLHFCVGELRSVQGNVLASHSACLAFAYISLSFVQLFGEQLPQTLCIVMAFIIQFSFMACFFWLNLLCLHTWLQLNKAAPLKRLCIENKYLFLLYSIYGWGLPILFISVSVIMDLTPTIPSSYLKPNFGLDSCWFHSDNAALSYFYGPISILLIVNIVFFILTTRLMIYTNKTQIVNHITTFEEAVICAIKQKRKKSFIEAFLLFLAMGLNWILEIISWVVGGPPQIWILFDIINTLQGIIVFYIFVMRNPRVRRIFINYLHKICCRSENNILTRATPPTTLQNNDKSSQKLIPLVPIQKSNGAHYTDDC